MVLRKLSVIQHGKKRVGIGNGTNQAGKQGTDLNLEGLTVQAKSYVFILKRLKSQS